MELASQECCLHSVLFTRRYVTFVLVIITFVFTLYNVVVLEKNVNINKDGGFLNILIFKLEVN